MAPDSVLGFFVEARQRFSALAVLVHDVEATSFEVIMIEAPEQVPRLSTFVDIKNPESPSLFLLLLAQQLYITCEHATSDAKPCKS